VKKGTKRVALGINGDVEALPGGKLQMILTRKFEHITVLTNATLQKTAPEEDLKAADKTSCD
jgi:hypothetical protein